MNRFPFSQIFIALFMLGTSLAFAPSKVVAYGDRECQFMVENNTDQVIGSLYIVPSSAKKTHLGWKINRLGRPLQVGDTAMVKVRTTRDARFWNAFGIFEDRNRYVFMRKDVNYDTGKYIWDHPPCDDTWTLEDYQNVENWNWSDFSR
ncbi:hypothetical protein H6F44_22345 [Pseudanabaena sp. FACHB-1277]|uniref:Uncharacterized protein n=1 Tax=Pseudanabaena cinerea FACHB-1277 TaxID=2949581 RepID=A0A926UWZ2_9CYAN|nr:hypothetical protein [Pseudanabaena cinerea]MBD2152829.1 hypothetical protein [Pseudanabaena cinerea FACHB-1277]